MSLAEFFGKGSALGPPSTGCIMYATTGVAGFGDTADEGGTTAIENADTAINIAETL